MEIVYIIPAKRNSERCPNKNNRNFTETDTLATLAMQFAYKMNNGGFHVLTESHTTQNFVSLIAEMRGWVGMDYIEEPIRLTTPQTTETDFIGYCVGHLKLKKDAIVIVLYPTTPFRTQETINRVIHAFEENPDTNHIRTMQKCKEHPYKMFRDSSTPVEPSEFVKSYQSLPDFWAQSPVGVGYRVLQDYKISASPIRMLEIRDEIEGIDINTELDFVFAQFIAERKKQ